MAPWDRERRDGPGTKGGEGNGDDAAARLLRPMGGSDESRESRGGDQPSKLQPKERSAGGTPGGHTRDEGERGNWGQGQGQGQPAKRAEPFSASGGYSAAPPPLFANMVKGAKELFTQGFGTDQLAMLSLSNNGVSATTMVQRMEQAALGLVTINFPLAPAPVPGSSKGNGNGGGGGLQAEKDGTVKGLPSVGSLSFNTINQIQATVSMPHWAHPTTGASLSTTLAASFPPAGAGSGLLSSSSTGLTHGALVEYRGHSAALSGGASWGLRPTVCASAVVAGPRGTTLEGLSMGGDVVFDTAANALVQSTAGLSVNSNGTSAAILVDAQTMDALDVYLSKQVEPSLTLGTHIRKSLRQAHAQRDGSAAGVPGAGEVVSFAARYDTPVGFLKGQMDNNGRVGACWQHNVTPQASLCLSAEMDMNTQTVATGAEEGNGTAGGSVKKQMGPPKFGFSVIVTR